MLEERLKITNLEDRLKTEMSGGVMGDINATAEALRLALQQEERLKLELGNFKNMESLLGNAGMARMLQMMEQDPKNFAAMNHSGLESGPGSSSGSVPHSPKNTGNNGHDAGASGPSPELTSAVQQIRRDVELTKVTGSEANLQYQRDIGAHQNYRKADTDDENDEEEQEYRKDDQVSVYPKDMSTDAMNSYRKEMNAPMSQQMLEGVTPMVYPQSPMYPAHGHHSASGLQQAQGSD